MDNEALHKTMKKKIYQQPLTHADILCVGMSQVMENSDTDEPWAEIENAEGKLPIGIRYI